jgi:hypothetical protein
MLRINKEKDDQRTSPSYTREHSPYFALFKSLLIVSVVLGIMGLAGVGLGVLYVVRGEGSAAATMIAPSLMVIGMAVVINAIGWLLRLDSEANRIRDNFATTISRDIQSSAQPKEHLTKDLDEIKTLLDRMVRQLGEIQENSLLDEAGRKKKFDFIIRQERNQVYAEVDALAKTRDWARARNLLQHLIEKYPEIDETKDRLAQLEEKRRGGFEEELTQMKKTVNDLIAISAWDRSISLAETFVAKHPDMPTAKELAGFVHDERTKFRNEHIKRMYADIQKSTGRKRWNDALQVARQLIEKYPESMEAEALRVQMDTMESNAEIEKRQQFEEQIKDLVKRHNFIQAVELAHYVISQFPNSPQAVALRGQLPKLEELAREQEKEINL